MVGCVQEWSLLPSPRLGTEYLDGLRTQDRIDTWRGRSSRPDAPLLLRVIEALLAMDFRRRCCGLFLRISERERSTSPRAGAPMGVSRPRRFSV